MAAHELGWTPKVPMDQGVEETIEWFKSNWNEIESEPLEYIHKV